MRTDFLRSEKCIWLGVIQDWNSTFKWLYFVALSCGYCSPLLLATSLRSLPRTCHKKFKDPAFHLISISLQIYVCAQSLCICSVSYEYPPPHLPLRDSQGFLSPTPRRFLAHHTFEEDADQNVKVWIFSSLWQYIGSMKFDDQFTSNSSVLLIGSNGQKMISTRWAQRVVWDEQGWDLLEEPGMEF